jgi:3-deoxy-manno-octulosonate cytidylyltransferase (CMP-KDO synthetase)
VWQVAQRPEYRDAELILNVQGDEPLVARAAVTGAVDQVRDGADIGTAAGWLAPAAVRDPNKVKVGVNLRGRATRFLRTLQGTSCPHHGEALFHHIGVYAYRRAALQRWAALPPVPEERLERLEQLRPLLHGMSIGVSPLEDAPAPGVDTAGDLEDVEHLLAAAGPGMDG